jgi:hypothetical protein
MLSAADSDFWAGTGAGQLKMEDEPIKEENVKPLFGAFLLPNGARYGKTIIQFEILIYSC